MRILWGMALAAVLAAPAAAQDGQNARGDKPFAGIAVAGTVNFDDVDVDFTNTNDLLGFPSGGEDDTESITPTGTSFGGWIGYRHQFDNDLVLGAMLRGRGSTADANEPGAQEIPGETGEPVTLPTRLGRAAQELTGVELDLSQAFNIEANTERTVGVDLQAGYAFEVLMPFFQIGYTNTRLKLRAGDQQILDSKLDGYRFGGGIAWRIGRRLSLQVNAFKSAYEEPSGIEDRFLSLDKTEFGGGLVYTF